MGNVSLVLGMGASYDGTKETLTITKDNQVLILAVLYGEL